MKELRSPFTDSLPDLPPSFDRRTHERIPLNIALRVLSFGPVVEKTAEAVCTDLSEGGLAFETAAELSVGDIVGLEFRVHGEMAYRCHARLTYRMARRYGGYFLSAE
jgi:PilZ domain